MTGRSASPGRWERWERDGAALGSCTLITTEPNALMRPIHDRMPVLVRRGDYGLWLDPGRKDAAVLKGLLRPYPAAELVARPVSTLVHAPANDRPDCVRPI
jgi:putative SOS response-associated peptidase YedK